MGFWSVQEGQYILKKCGRCKGSGWGWTGSSYCAACHGRGTVWVMKPGVKCAACKGSGFGLHGNSLCGACGGSGWAYTRYEEVAKPQRVEAGKS